MHQLLLIASASFLFACGEDEKDTAADTATETEESAEEEEAAE
tara:strand:+ start:248 stop:376 length:129 start_codon:yes stop_codon:yes gene_type:complete